MLTLWLLTRAISHGIRISAVHCIRSAVCQVNIVVVCHRIIVACLKLTAPVWHGVLEQNAVGCWRLGSELWLILAVGAGTVAIRGLVVVPIQEAVAVRLKNVWCFTATLFK